MYSAEQIRKKVYVPDQSNFMNEEDLTISIVVADSSGRNCVRIRAEVMYAGNLQKLRFSGYNVESVEFLGTKFWQISW